MKAKTWICGIVLLIVIFILTGCYDFRSQFIEPEGYTITYIKQKNRRIYGYIKDEELSAYMDGKIEKMTVLYPYKDSRHEGQYIIVNTSKIQSITLGEYKDVR